MTNANFLLKGRTPMAGKMCVVGLGYIGLPTAVMFALHGVQVHGVDTDVDKIRSINQGKAPFKESGLQERLTNVIDSGLLTASTEPNPADVYIIAVPSPILENKTADLAHIRDAARSLLPFIKKGDLVVLESTVPPRTVMDALLPILKETDLVLGKELFVSHSPERVIPGRVFEELVQNDRIVGGIEDVSAQMTKRLYETFVKGRILLTDATTAEMVKVIENTYRDVNIAFANELAKISEKIGVNVWEAIELANHHPRVNIHMPGPGVGGHCIPVDPWFLVQLQPDLAQMIYLARTINDSMPAYTAAKVQEIFRKKQIRHGKVALLGLTFKADIHDVRESPSFDVMKIFNEKAVNYTAYDPFVKTRNETPASFLKHADLILIMTDHTEFKELDPNEAASLVRSRLILDTKNCINREKWEKAGFEVFMLGHPKKG